VLSLTYNASVHGVVEPGYAMYGQPVGVHVEVRLLSLPDPSRCGPDAILPLVHV
jgi:hypothetical protein